MNEFDESVVAKLLELSSKVRTQIQKGSFETRPWEYAEIDVMSDDNFDKKERRPNAISQTRKYVKQLSLTRGLDQLKDWAKQLDIYKAAAQELADTYAIGTDEVFSSLDLLVFNIQYIPEEDMTQEELKALLTVYLRDWTHAPLQFNLELWVTGVTLDYDDLENHKCDIYEGLSIRQPVRQDFELKMRSDHELTIKNALPSDFDFILRSYMPSSSFYHVLHDVTPGCIIEFSYKSAYEAGWTRDYKYGHPPSEIQNLKDEINAEIDNLIACFRLFKLGSVDRMLLHWNPNSIKERMHFDSIVKEVSIPLYRFSLTEDEIHLRLGNFIKSIKPLIPQKPNMAKKGAGTDPNIPLYIALNNYFDSLSDLEGIEHQITSVIMCLEALFLTENIEVSHKLRLRVAGLLRFAGYKPLEVYHDVNTAYSIRSKFVHGSREYEKLRRLLTSDRKALAEKVTDYARHSLLIFLQLKKLMGKEGIYRSDQGLKYDVITMIDESLLDPTKYKELAAIIKENCYYC